VSVELDGSEPLDALLDIVAQAVTPGPYLMGEQFTAADVVIGSALRFGMAFGMMPQRADLAGYVARLYRTRGISPRGGEGQGGERLTHRKEIWCVGAGQLHSAVTTGPTTARRTAGHAVWAWYAAGSMRPGLVLLTVKSTTAALFSRCA